MNDEKEDTRQQIETANPQIIDFPLNLKSNDDLSTSETLIPVSRLIFNFALKFHPFDLTPPVFPQMLVQRPSNPSAHHLRRYLIISFKFPTPGKCSPLKV